MPARRFLFTELMTIDTQFTHQATHLRTPGNRNLPDICPIQL
jgi:hypothetical protein